MKDQKPRRTLFVSLFILLVAGVAMLGLSAQTEAVGCDGNTHSSVNTVWLVTPAAVARSADGATCSDAARPVCREECIVACGEEIGQGNFACFPH